MIRNRFYRKMKLYDATADGGASDTTATEAQDSTTGAEETATAIPEAEPLPEATEDTSIDVDKLKSEMKSEFDEALKKQGMTPEELAVYELEQRESAIAAREEKLARDQLKMDTVKLLSKSDVPVDAADFVMGTDIKDTVKRTQKFKAMFDSAVQAKVQERLRGKTPTAGSSLTSVADSIKAQFEQGLGM